MSIIENKSVPALIIPENDPRLSVDNLKYPGETGDVLAYVARPKGAIKLPGVIVISRK